MFRFLSLARLLTAHPTLEGKRRFMPPAKTTTYQPQLDGLRAVAAVAVLVTHVAFQTGVSQATWWGAVAARMDYFVAVFFALSGYLLWGKNYGRRYYQSRLLRIVPAYVVCVVACFAFLPETFGATAGVFAATVTFTQLYLPQGLVGGLTHLWSLCVEVVFYLALPVIARLCTTWWRTVVLVVLSLGWAFIPPVADSPRDGIPNMQIFPPAFFLWFAVGILARHITCAPQVARVFRWAWPWWLMALVVAWVAGNGRLVPLGLVHPSPTQFLWKVLLGGLFAALVLYPVVFGPGVRALAGTPARWLGKRSYSFYLWHLPVLSVVLPVVGRGPFSGGFWLVLTASIAATTVVAAMSYAWVEDPLARLKAKQPSHRGEG